MKEDSYEKKSLLARAADGDRDDWGSLLVRHAERLRHMLTLRIDPRLRSRIEPADVLQEAYIEASSRFNEYLSNPRMPFYLWLRFLVGQKLITLHRHHLGTEPVDGCRCSC